MTISLPVQTDMVTPRPAGALVVLVAVQLSVPGLYLPPVFKAKLRKNPPQTIISLPDQTAVCSYRPGGALVVLVAVQLSMLGLYLAPVFKYAPSYPPQTIISLPVHTAVQILSVAGCVGGAGGCPTVGAGIVSTAGVHKAAAIISAPYDHFSASPHCRVT